tara:strand:+ start:657 stop:1424 length:768 start_codon:yes stop_codon:yes gene_type:complete
MNQTIDYIKHKLQIKPDIALVLGSGLAGIQDILTNTKSINYSDIPGYFNTSVKGHDGKFIFGNFKNKNILMALGRFHYYEGLSFEEVGLPIKIFNQLGCNHIIITNSSGCLVPDWDLGNIMIVDGHYDFTFRFGSDNPELVSGDEYYNEELINLALSIDPNLKKGKYGWVLGPLYETKAEIKNMMDHGVNAVGMSTIPEVIMAQKIGINILVLALMSNYGVGLTNEKLTHERVLENSKKYNQNFQLLLRSILSKI